jgi:dethiobiotin synthase
MKFRSGTGRFADPPVRGTRLGLFRKAAIPDSPVGKLATEGRPQEVSLGQNYFVTGTDTGVGKTYIAGKLLSSLMGDTSTAGYIKPFQTGCHYIDGIPASPDVGEVKGMLGPRVSCHMFYAYELPACPLLAASDIGSVIDFDKAVRWTKETAAKFDIAVVEGAGGLMVPLTEKHTMLDFASALGYPVILVAESKLGCINHTLLSINALKGRGLGVAALILNDFNPIQDDRVRVENSRMINRFAPDVRIIDLGPGGELEI